MSINTQDTNSHHCVPKLLHPLSIEKDNNICQILNNLSHLSNAPPNVSAILDSGLFAIHSNVSVLIVAISAKIQLIPVIEKINNNECKIH